MSTNLEKLEEKVVKQWDKMNLNKKDYFIKRIKTLIFFNLVNEIKSTSEILLATLLLIGIVVLAFTLLIVIPVILLTVFYIIGLGETLSMLLTTILTIIIMIKVLT